MDGIGFSCDVCLHVCGDFLFCSTASLEKKKANMSHIYNCYMQAVCGECGKPLNLSEAVNRKRDSLACHRDCLPIEARQEMPQFELPIEKRSYTQADLDRAVSEFRLRCARWLAYTGAGSEELYQDILYGDLSAADGDKDADEEMEEFGKRREP